VQREARNDGIVFFCGGETSRPSHRHILGDSRTDLAETLSPQTPPVYQRIVNNSRKRHIIRGVGFLTA
jgi:hypothetical protein